MELENIKIGQRVNVEQLGKPILGTTVREIIGAFLRVDTGPDILEVHITDVFPIVTQPEPLMKAHGITAGMAISAVLIQYPLASQQPHLFFKGEYRHMPQATFLNLAFDKPFLTCHFSPETDDSYAHFIVFVIDESEA